MGNSLKFIQISDIHLGARVLPRCFSTTSEFRLEREEEILSLLETLVDIFREEDAEVLFVVGDLFDSDAVDSKIINRVFNLFSKLPYTVILPGNHDYLSGASPYSQYERSWRGLNDIPDNVFVFSGHEYSSIYLPKRVDVSITGRPFTGNSVVTEHRLAEKIPRDPAEISILLHHGARTQFNFEEKMKVTAPFTAAELLAQGFSYTALGHYHSFSTIKSADGMIKAAYAGRPFACEFRAKNGCILIGEATRNGVEKLVQYDIDTRRIFDLSIHCDNIEKNSDILSLAKDECARNGVLQTDIVRLRFTGTKKNDFKPELLIPANELFVSVGDFSELHIGYDVEQLLKIADGKAATAESIFIKEMYTKICDSDNIQEKAILSEALDYGMKALKGIRIIPNDILVDEE